MDLKVFCAKCGRIVSESRLVVIKGAFCCPRCAKAEERK